MLLKTGFAEYGGMTPIFDSYDLRFATGGVTIDNATVTPDQDNQRILYAGEVLGRITASGLYGPYDAAAADGRETARYILAATKNVTDGNHSVGVLDRARIHRARMPRQFTDAELEVIKEQLYAAGCVITFTEPKATPGPKVEGVTLSPATLTLSVGASGQLLPLFEPSNAVNQKGSFASSAAGVATVDAEGLVIAVSAGTATITFTSHEGGFTATATVTVS